MALKDMFNNYYSGRPGQPDLTEKDLPATRPQLFGEVLKVRFFSLIGLSLAYAIFWLPAAAWTFINLLVILRAENVTEIAGALVRYFPVLIPLIAITGPANAGIGLVTRNWARDEHADTFADFKDGMRKNLKQGFLLGIVSGIVYGLSGLAAVYYLQTAGGSFVNYIPAVITLIVAFLWDLMSMVVPIMIVTYAQSFGAILRNAFIMTVAELPRAILIRLATCILPIIAIISERLFPGAFPTLLGLCTTLYIFIMPGFNKLLIASFGNMVCEKYINPHIEGARTNIGLRPR